jgi:hypothetical protein
VTDHSQLLYFGSVCPNIGKLWRGRQLFESHFFEVEMREFYIDWMRTIAVLMVVFVHVVVSVLRVVEVQPLLEGKINGTFRVLTQMGMPMLVSLMFGGVAEFF